MRYIHSGNSTLVWRKYKQKVFIFSLSLLVVGNLGVGVYNLGLNGNIKKLDEQITAYSTDINQSKSEVSEIRDKLINDSVFNRYSADGTKIVKDPIQNLYPVDSLYAYVHEAPSSIVFSKINLAERFSYLKGQATTYEELESYINVLKNTGLFSSVEVRNIEYMSIGDKVEFELRCVKGLIGKDEMKDLILEEGRGN